MIDGQYTGTPDFESCPISLGNSPASSFLSSCVATLIKLNAMFQLLMEWYHNYRPYEGRSTQANLDVKDIEPSFNIVG